uniref:Uncharacterized protein n=1 Tax=Oryza punctata TaxID=4537 RepID=A0A0E0K3W8_ORYPU
MASSVRASAYAIWFWFGCDDEEGVATIGSTESSCGAHPSIEQGQRFAHGAQRAAARAGALLRAASPPPRRDPSRQAVDGGSGRTGSAAWCHATAADGVAAASSELEAIWWGTAKLQAAREAATRWRMRHWPISANLLSALHAGTSCKMNTRRRCAVVSTKNLEAIADSIQRAFATVDANLSTWKGKTEQEQAEQLDGKLGHNLA